MNVAVVTQRMIEDIRKYFESAGIKNAVIGNSGGKDSAVVIGLLAKALGPENVYTYALPCHSIQQDSDHAWLVAKKFGVHYDVVNLDEAYDAVEYAIRMGTGEDASAESKVNIKPRLRMTTLYGIAQTKHALVVGTGNRCEAYVGYFTKYGDGGVDYNPLAEIFVSEVYEIARYIGVPTPIIDKAPSDGLSGKSDEEKMGITYDQIEEFITTGHTDLDAEAIIVRMHKAAAHKMKMPATFHV